MSTNASSFDLSLDEAEKIISEVTTALRSFSKYAVRAGIDNAEQQTMLNAIGITDA